MSLKGLEKLFSPKTIAVIGASNTENTVGYSLMANLLGHGFEGTVYPINPKRESVQGVHAYKNIKDVPRNVDLAIIATPAPTVPQVIEECGQAKVKGAVIISAGFKETGEEGLKLEKKISKIIQKYGMRVIGPNCLGIINPRLKLNASFAIKTPQPGNIAFISQSGAICSSIIDWAQTRNIGFSYFVSIGSMMDVDFGDLIDFFGYDSKTQTIIIYMESISNAKKFMSAASGFARNKPIIIVKSGRFEEGRQAVVSHTGAIAGFDEVYSAAFKRAGVVRVMEIDDLFDISEKLARGPLPSGPKITVVTNAGGPGVMATDRIIEQGGQITELQPETIEKLNTQLPASWSKNNPIDVLGDAGAQRYSDAINAALEDENTDSLSIILTPQAGTNALAVAKAITDTRKKSTKPITACFMGGESVEQAIKHLREHKLPTYSTPEKAINPLILGYEYVHNLKLLHETPEELTDGKTPEKKHLTQLIESAYERDHLILTERESKQFLEAYNIPTSSMKLAKDRSQAAKLAEEIGYPVVMKIESPDITHKTDAGGVILSILSAKEAEQAYDRITQNARKYNEKARIEGVTVSKMIEGRGFEVLLGAKKDEVFGEVIVFGAGGTLVEFLRDKGIGLPPLNQTLAKRIMEETRSYKLLKNGSRDRAPANLRELEKILINFSQMIIENPQIKEVDINPILATPDFAIALDARIVLDEHQDKAPLSHICITPYPKDLTEVWVDEKDAQILLRPIKAEDEHKIKKLFETLSEETIRYRFFHPIKEVTHNMLVRYCHNDYEREIAIVAEHEERILGVSRLMFDPGESTAEFSVVVTDKWQNKGLGTKLVSKIVDIARQKNLKKVYATVIKENQVMVHIAKKLGFNIEHSEEPSVYNLALYLSED